MLATLLKHGLTSVVHVAARHAVDVARRAEEEDKGEGPRLPKRPPNVEGMEERDELDLLECETSLQQRCCDTTVFTLHQLCAAVVDACLELARDGRDLDALRSSALPAPGGRKRG